MNNINKDVTLSISGDKFQSQKISPSINKKKPLSFRERIDNAARVISAREGSSAAPGSLLAPLLAPLVAPAPRSALNSICEYSNRPDKRKHIFNVRSK